MTDRPIIFSAPMVLALLAGRKTMTRRLAWRFVGAGYPGDENLVRKATPWQRVKPGDRLWVRESLALHGAFGLPLSEAPQVRPDGERVWSYVVDDVPNRSGGRPSVHMPRWASRLTLTVTGARVERLQAISETDAQAEGMVFVNHGTDAYGRARDGWHSDSAEAAKGPDYCLSTARFAFANLWGSLHGAVSWAANPEVVALTFTVHQHNVDATERAAA